MKVRIEGQLDRAHRMPGTVTITRKPPLFGVRPLRSRREYVLPLSTVAEIVVAKVTKAELGAKRRLKAWGLA